MLQSDAKTLARKEFFRSKSYLIWQVVEQLERGDRFTSRDIHDLLNDKRVSKTNVSSYLHYCFKSQWLEKKAKIKCPSGREMIQYEMIEKPPEPQSPYPENVKRFVDKKSGVCLKDDLPTLSSDESFQRSSGNHRFPIHPNLNLKIGDKVSEEIFKQPQRMLEFKFDLKRVSTQELIEELYRRRMSLVK